MDLNVSDFGAADPALVLFNTRVLFSIMLQQLGEGVELHGAVGTLVGLLDLESGNGMVMALPVAFHPFRF